VTEILILKTAALGDVLRTTSILPGLKERYPGCRITWVTAPGAVDLVRTHPQVDAVETLDPSSESAAEDLATRLGETRWTKLISLDDELPLCRLAARLSSEQLSGAYLGDDGRSTYTPDVAPWFDMGLLSVHGKSRADQLKVLNTRSHPQIFAEMLGIRMGKPRLVLSAEARAFARSFAERHGLEPGRLLVGLNTGAGGRWLSKQLSVERTVELGRLVARARHGDVTFVVFGGPPEARRNQAIVAGFSAEGLPCVDAGCENGLLQFAALIELCDLLVASDSLALHVAIALDVRVVAFFAPTSAAEIELYNLGEKVASTAPDYCSYRRDADTSTITAERLASSVLAQLDATCGHQGTAAV